MLGENLKTLRTNKKMTQQDVADMLNIPRGTYAHYEINKREPDNATLILLADFFEVTVDYLLGREEKTTTIAAHRTDNPTDDLPKEALDKIEEFKELMRLKYGKK